MIEAIWCKLAQVVNGQGRETISFEVSRFWPTDLKADRQGHTRQKIDCSRHCKCWPWKGSRGVVHRLSCPRMAGEHLADALVWFCMDCCMLYSLLLYVVDLWTVVTLSTTSWNTNFTASFCAGLTIPVSGVFRISVRGWGAVDADRGAVWSRKVIPPQRKSCWPKVISLGALRRSMEQTENTDSH